MTYLPNKSGSFNRFRRPIRCRVFLLADSTNVSIILDRFIILTDCLSHRTNRVRICSDKD